MNEPQQRTATITFPIGTAGAGAGLGGGIVAAVMGLPPDAVDRVKELAPIIVPSLLMGYFLWDRAQLLGSRDSAIRDAMQARDDRVRDAQDAGAAARDLVDAVSQRHAAESQSIREELGKVKGKMGELLEAVRGARTP